MLEPCYIRSLSIYPLTCIFVLLTEYFFLPLFHIGMCIYKSTLIVFIMFVSRHSTLGYERVYLPLYKMADTPFHIQGDEYVREDTCFFRNESNPMTLFSDFSSLLYTT